MYTNTNGTSGLRAQNRAQTRTPQATKFTTKTVMAGKGGSSANLPECLDVGPGNSAGNETGTVHFYQ